MDVTTTGVTNNAYGPTMNMGIAGAGTTDTTLTGGAGAGAGAGDAGAGAGGAGDAGAGAGAGAGALDPSQSTLSANFAPYIYDMLLKGQTAANLPFQPFTGQRFAFGAQDPETGQYSAGYSPLETRGLDFLKDLGQYGPDAFKGGLGEIGNIASFMSPYQQDVIDIEKREAQKAGDIAKRNLASKFLTPGGAGAFGGSRYAIESGMLERDLQQNLADIQTKGLQAAYDRATKERQYATEQGMEGLGAVLEGGRRERAIEQSPLDFGYSQWLESVRRPAEQAKEMQGLLAGLPLQAPEYQPEQSAIAAALQGLIGALGLGKLVG